MRLYFLLLLVWFFIISCDKHNSNAEKESSKNTALYYFSLGKKKELSINQRLTHFTKAYKIASDNELDSIAIRALSFKAFLFKRQKSDSTFFYSKKMLALAKKKQDSFQIGRAYFKIGEYFANQQQEDSAFYYYNLSRNVFVDIRHNTEVAKKLSLMGRILIDNNNLDFAEKILVDGLKYLEFTQDSSSFSSVYHNLSLIYRKQQDEVKAKDYIKKAILFATNPRKKAILENTELNILRDFGAYSMVLGRYDAILKSKVVKNDSKEHIRILDNQSYVNWKLNPDLDISNELFRSLSIRKRIKDASGMIASYARLMEFFEKKDTSISVKYADSLYRLTRKMQNIEDRITALNHLRKFSNNNQKNYGDQLFELLDSIKIARFQSSNRYAAIIYDIDQKEKKLIKARQEKTILEVQKRNQQIILTSFILFLVLVTVFIIYTIQERNKIKSIKERHVMENYVSQKLHDEVGNDLFHLLHQLQSNSSSYLTNKKEEVLEGIHKVYNKIRNFSRELSIETGEEYHNELSFLFASFNDINTKVIFFGSDPAFWEHVVAYKKRELFLILRELLTNMKKHSEADFVTINFTKEKKKIVVKYRDDGIGVDLKEIPLKNGLRNVENRIREMKGSITFESKPNQGFRSEIILYPKK